ncbi:MAG: cation:proton antiporter [Prochlorotrichaceae cyanobacterium]
MNIALPLTDPVYIFCVILLSLGIAPWIAAKTKLPTLVILMILGALLSPNVLGILDRNAAVQMLEKIGLLSVMLLAGIQMNLTDFRKVGVRALIFGLLTFAVPFIAGFTLSYLLQYPPFTCLLLGILFSPHTLIAYPIVMRWGISQRECVSVLIGGTVITSILTLCSLTIVQSLVKGQINHFLWIKIGVILPLLIVLCLWGIEKLSEFILTPNFSPRNFSSESGQFIFIFSALFVVASLTLLIGVDSIVGAFIAGLALNKPINRHKAAFQQVEFISVNLFIPCFLLSVGLLANPKVLIQDPGNLGLATLVILVAMGAKFVAAWLSGVTFHYQFSEVMLMTGMTLSRAAMVLVIALYGQGTILAGSFPLPLLNEGLFNAIVLYILVTCLVGPLITDRFGSEIARQPLPE